MADELRDDIETCLEAAAKLRELGVKRLAIGDIVIEMLSPADYAMAQAFARGGEMVSQEEDPRTSKSARFRVAFGRDPSEAELEVFPG